MIDKFHKFVPKLNSTSLVVKVEASKHLKNNGPSGLVPLRVPFIVLGQDLKGARSAMHPEFVTSQCVLARLCLTPLLGAVFLIKCFDLVSPLCQKRVHGNAPTCLEPLSGSACPARRVSGREPPPYLETHSADESEPSSFTRSQMPSLPSRKSPGSIPITCPLAAVTSDEWYTGSGYERSWISHQIPKPSHCWLCNPSQPLIPCSQTSPTWTTPRSCRHPGVQSDTNLFPPKKKRRFCSRLTG